MCETQILDNSLGRFDVTRITTLLLASLLFLVFATVCQPTAQGQGATQISAVASVFPRHPNIQRPRYRKVVRRWRSVAVETQVKRNAEPIPQPNPIHPGLIATFQFFASIGGLLAFNSAIRGSSEEV